MLYDEFLAGTGCRDNEKNYRVYKDLEILYMNSELTKEKIYEYGKKLVDNSLSDGQVYWNLQIDKKIAEAQEQVNYYLAEVEYYKGVVERFAGYDEDSVKSGKFQIKRCTREARYYKNKIKELKTCKYV